MEKKAHILLVDDERQFSAMTQEYLEAKGYSTTLKHSGVEGYETFKLDKFDLCILDVKMPIKDGFMLAKEIRELNEHVPIIFLTGQTEKEDRIKGLSIGADDYVTKPFSMEELYLRVNNILKRSNYTIQKKKVEQKFNVGVYSFDPTLRELYLNDKIIKLTSIESKLLQMFCENDQGIIDRNLALKRIWGDDDFLRGRSLNVYVSKLRTFLKQDPNIEILNIHGIGYKLVIR